QRRAGPHALCRHRALRDRAAWRDLAGRSRPAGHADGPRYGAGGDVRGGVRRRHAVGSCVKPSGRISRSTGSTSISSTRASGGPRRQASIIWPTASSSPTISASTAPSLRLRTQPVRPSRNPVPIAQSRYPTPWTRPLMVRRACSAIGSDELDDLLVDLEAVARLGMEGLDRAVL